MEPYFGRNAPSRVSAGKNATLFASEGQVRSPGALTSGSFEGGIFPTGWDPVAMQ
jgi:hypothetical protein